MDEKNALAPFLHLDEPASDTPVSRGFTASGTYGLTFQELNGARIQSVVFDKENNVKSKRCHFCSSADDGKWSCTHCVDDLKDYDGCKVTAVLILANGSQPDDDEATGVTISGDSCAEIPNNCPSDGLTTY